MTPEELRTLVQSTTVGIGGQRTIPTPTRVYAPKSINTGSGVPDAHRVVTGSQTTILSDTSLLALTAAGGVGAYSLLARRDGR